MQLNVHFCRESMHLLDAAMTKVNHCLRQLSDEQIWWRPTEEDNSIGNLLLHMAGNLRQWAVTPLSGAVDERDRNQEFSHRGPETRDDLLARINTTVDEAKLLIDSLSESELLKKQTIQDFETTTLGAICHTTSHFVGHTHQIILLTRLQLGSNYQFQWTAGSQKEDAGNVPI